MAGREVSDPVQIILNHIRGGEYILDIIFSIGFIIIIVIFCKVYQKYESNKNLKKYEQSIKLEKRNIIYNENLKPEEMEIFQLIIKYIIKTDDDYLSNDKSSKILLFDLLTLTSLEETRSYGENMRYKEYEINEWFENIEYDTIDDFSEKNKFDFCLKNHTNNFKRAILISCSDMLYSNINPSNYIKYIENNFRNIDNVIGFAIFSRIGFDYEKSQAFLEIYYDIQGRISNDYIFLRKKNRDNRFHISKIENKSFNL
jgi:hypothetical protein